MRAQKAHTQWQDDFFKSLQCSRWRLMVQIIKYMDIAVLTFSSSASDTRKEANARGWHPNRLHMAGNGDGRHALRTLYRRQNHANIHTVACRAAAPEKSLNSQNDSSARQSLSHRQAKIAPDKMVERSLAHRGKIEQQPTNLCPGIQKDKSLKSRFHPSAKEL